MPKKINRNPRDYQVNIEGQDPYRSVDDLTVDELKQEVCYQMDVIEAIETEAEALVKLIQLWRSSKELPDKK